MVRPVYHSPKPDSGGTARWGTYTLCSRRSIARDHRPRLLCAVDSDRGIELPSTLRTERPAWDRWVAPLGGGALLPPSRDGCAWRGVGVCVVGRGCFSFLPEKPAASPCGGAV